MLKQTNKQNPDKWKDLLALNSAIIATTLGPGVCSVFVGSWSPSPGIAFLILVLLWWYMGT